MNNGNTTPTQTKIKFIQTLLAGLAVASFMVNLAIPSIILACVNTALFILCAYKICQKRSDFTVIVIVTAAMFAMLSITSLARVISLVVSAAAGGAMLCGSKKSRATFTIFSVVAYLVAFVVTGSLTEAISVFSALPAAIAFAVCSSKRVSRVSSICAASAAFLITALIPIALSAYAEFGTDVKLFIETARSNFSATVTEAINTVVSSVGEQYAEAFSADTVASTAELVFTLIPALYIISTNIIAFVASYLHMIIRLSLGKAPEKQEVIFVLSSVSAWIYIISFVMMFFSFGNSNAMRVFAVSMENINLILSPAFMLVGLFSFIATTRMGGSKSSIFKTVIIVLSFMYCGAFLLYPLAAAGVIMTFRVNKQRGMKNS